MKIKVCGLKYLDNLKEVLALQPDFVGFIFYSRSPRFFDQILPQTLNQLDFGITKKVGVFVNPTLAEVLDKGKLYGLDVVQLHGLETPDFCVQVQDCGFKVMKAISVSQAEDLLKIAYYNSVDYILLDTKTHLYGGSGVKFDWTLLDKIEVEIPLFLSGGIGPKDVEVIEEFKNKVYGIDINSKFEIRQGLKDKGLLRHFIDKIRSV